MASANEKPKNASAVPAGGNEAALRESLKRCSPETLQAALDFRKSNDASYLPSIVLGIIERFVEPEHHARLREADEDLRVIEDLGLDSLTMMEVVILVEEVVNVSIANDELRNLRTVGDIKVFIDHKVRGLPPPEPSRFLSIEELVGIMPQQPPFLFLQEATMASGWVSAKYRIAGDEGFLAGHFPENPVFPASILLESLGQLAVLFLLEGKSSQIKRKVSSGSIYFTGCEGVRCHRVCRPGDVLKLSIKPKRIRHPLATFEGSIRVGQEKAAFAEEITLTFDYVPDEPETTSAAAAAVPDESDRSRGDPSAHGRNGTPVALPSERLERK
ncbi:MAG: phosphopantetheine-binding protein [Opitutaceae bacterium]